VTRSKMTKRTLTGKARMRAELVELTADMHAAGIVSADAVRKTTLKMLGPDALPDAARLSGKDIVSIRKQSHLSQSVFARLLAVSTGTLSKWERDEIAPRGPARRLLQIIKAKGVAAVI
jgi:putative transcriptional regulator